MKDIISEVIKRLKNADKELTHAISSGVNVHDYATYQRFVGQKSGIQDALDIIESILSEDEEDFK
jgi:hypothetical protein